MLAGAQPPSSCRLFSVVGFTIAGGQIVESDILADPEGPATRLVDHRMLSGRLTRRFEKLDRIAVGIVDLNLAAARTCFHLVAEMDARLLERGNAARQIGDFQHDAVPSAGLLMQAVRHWP